VPAIPIVFALLMAITRLLGKGLQQCDLATGEAAGNSEVSEIAPIAPPSRSNGSGQVRLPANVSHHLEQLGLGIDIADVDELPIQYRPAGNRRTRRHQGMRPQIRATADAPTCRTARSGELRRRRTGTTSYPSHCTVPARGVTIMSNTGCGSPGEADITFSTSMVADCCSIRSPYSLLRAANSARHSFQLPLEFGVGALQIGHAFSDRRGHSSVRRAIGLRPERECAA